METYGIQSTSTTAIPEEALSNDINYLFVARYNIETELRKNYSTANQESSNRPEPIFKITENLVRNEMISPKINVLRNKRSLFGMHSCNTWARSIISQN